eukprot:6492562-Amphidinium_carterae.3
MGDLGKRTLQDMCLSSFPSSDVAISPEDSYKRIVEITKTDLWQFVEKSAHGEVEKVKKWVQNLADGFAPRAPVLNSSAFLHQAWSRIAFFARESKKPRAKKSEDGEVLPDIPIFGAEALEMIHKLVKKKGDKATSDDLKPLVSMIHLLSDATKKDVEQMSADLVQRLGTKRPASASTTHASALVPKKPKTEAAQEAEAAADDAFA